VKHKAHSGFRLTRGGQPILSAFAALALAENDAARVALVRLAKRTTYNVSSLRHEDEVDVIVHQAPRKAHDTMRRAPLPHQREIGGAILIAKEDRQAPVATLRDVVRNRRDNDARQAGHDGRVSTDVQCVNYVLCPRNLCVNYVLCPRNLVSPELVVSPELRVPGTLRNSNELFCTAAADPVSGVVGMDVAAASGEIAVSLMVIGPSRL
jgi:hypothetical protein